MLKLTNISALFCLCKAVCFTFHLLFFYFHFTLLLLLTLLHIHFTLTFHSDLLLWCLFYMVYLHPGCWELAHFHVWLSKGTLPKHSRNHITMINTTILYNPPPPWWCLTWNIFLTDSFRKKIFFSDTLDNEKIL